ncbi:MAG: DUF3576 domain-containing protein [Pseudomonadota bacterium]
MAIRNFNAISIAPFAVALLIAGCGTAEPEPEPRQVEASNADNGGLLDNLLGGVTGGQRGENITVNSYLWRASLDTVSFLPLNTADPFGGVIITDWYSPPEAQDERFKVTVYILDRELRADGLRVAVFRQTREPGTGWVEAQVDKRTARDLENAILKRARQMRIRGS